MRSQYFALVCVVSFAILSCQDGKSVGLAPSAVGGSSETPRSHAKIGINVVASDREIAFEFSICGAKNAEPFIDRLIVTKLRPRDEAGTMCMFESVGNDVLSGTWRYGQKQPGFGQCWPLTEGEYVVVAMGAGAGETRFSLTQRWLRAGYSVRILKTSCH